MYLPKYVQICHTMYNGYETQLHVLLNIKDELHELKLIKSYDICFFSKYQ